MEVKASPAQTDNLVTLQFIPDLSTVKYELFEVDNELLESLGKQNLSIKSYMIDKVNTAALCTNDTTYKLKRSETSNTMLVTGLKTGNIYKQT